MLRASQGWSLELEYWRKLRNSEVLQPNMAALFINIEWKLCFSLFISHLSCVLCVIKENIVPVWTHFFCVFAQYHDACHHELVLANSANDNNRLVQHNFQITAGILWSWTCRQSYLQILRWIELSINVSHKQVTLYFSLVLDFHALVLEQNLSANQPKLGCVLPY